MDCIKVVLAEDHALVREGTRQVLERYTDISVIGEASDGQEALDLVQRLLPDVLLLDIRMPKRSGVEVAHMVEASSPDTKLLVLSAHDDDEYILTMMNAGAAGYLLKTARAVEVADAIRRVHRGETVLHPSIAAKLARIFARRGAADENTQLLQLSHREREILDLAARGMRNKAIAEALVISNRTVEGHFNSILSKLGVSSRLEAVLTAMTHGWIATPVDNSDVSQD